MGKLRLVGLITFNHFKVSEVMALEWKTVPFQPLQKAVLLVYLAMLVHHDYMYKLNRVSGAHILEESTISKITLPFIIVCPEVGW